MDPARWDRLERLVAQALARPPEEREAFLEEACEADEALRAEIELLLRHSDEASAFIDRFSEEAFELLTAALSRHRSQKQSSDGSSLVDQTFSHFRVVERLGAGGMGVVYKAKDQRLERFAALKFLPPHLSADADARDRFVTEARAASALDHPSICTIYEISETEEDRLFIAMAYYQGHTLRQKIKSGPIAPEEAADYALQLADGLGRAHDAGIIHRDVKPANVMITDEGVVKILDFGIAKMRNVNLTVEGMTPGTIAYMSPEQVRGVSVDHRSDIWSLGVVLYEMLAGERPFRGEYEQAIIYSILHDEPAPLDIDWPEGYEDLGELIEACLQKDPEARPATMEGVCQRLQALGQTPVVAGPDRSAGRPDPTVEPTGRPMGIHRIRRPVLLGVVLLLLMLGVGTYAFVAGDSAPVVSDAEAAEIERSIAVLPFANMSPDDEDVYFADGMTDDILTHLSMVPDFSVISRTSSMLYRGSEQRASSIAGELGVRYILQGSVRRAGDRVRITSQLIDGQTDQNVWAQTYDRQLEDVFAVQTDIARAIADALETELSSGVEERIERRPTDDLVAYDLFVRGREEFYRLDHENVLRAMDSFRAAIERDPNFTLARAWLARTYGIYAVNHGGGSAWADSTITVSRQALAQQPDLPEAHLALGTGLVALGRYGEAEEVFLHVLELRPNDPHATTNLGIVYAQLGRWDEAIRFTRRSLEHSPSHYYLYYSNLGFFYTTLGFFERAEEMFERSLRLREDYWFAISSRAWLDFLRGHREAALTAWEQMAEATTDDAAMQLISGGFLIFGGQFEKGREPLARAYEIAPTAHLQGPLVGVLYGFALDRSGYRERAMELYAETEQYVLERIEAGSKFAGLYYSLAGVHARRGDVSQALHWLEQAVQFGWTQHFYTKQDPMLESLQGELQFEALIDQMEQRLEAQRERVLREGW